MDQPQYLLFVLLLSNFIGIISKGRMQYFFLKSNYLLENIGFLTKLNSINYILNIITHTFCFVCFLEWI